ncbi:unnamed protein product, partial [Musa hybrid cultivar]
CQSSGEALYIGAGRFRRGILRARHATRQDTTRTRCLYQWSVTVFGSALVEYCGPLSTLPTIPRSIARLAASHIHGVSAPPRISLFVPSILLLPLLPPPLPLLLLLLLLLLSHRHLTPDSPPMSPSRSPLGLSPGFRLAACLFPGRQPGSAGAGPVEPSDGKESGEAERGKEEKIRVWESLMRGESASSILAPSKKAKVEPDLETRRAAVWSRVNQLLSASLSDIFAIMEKEMQFQVKGIDLITTLNFVCCIVLKTLVSHLIDEYSEAYAVYLCTLANFEVYIGSLFPKDPIVELDFPSYGHVSHDYYMSNGKKILGASMFPQGLSYEVNLLIGCIDYDKLEKKDMGLRSQKMLVWKERLYYSREWEFDVCM